MAALKFEEITQFVGEWHKRTFGDGRARRGLGRKLLEETSEFFAAPSEAEAADVMICLMAIAHREQWDLLRAVADKMEVLIDPQRNQLERETDGLLIR